MLRQCSILTPETFLLKRSKKLGFLIGREVHRICLSHLATQSPLLFFATKNGVSRLVAQVYEIPSAKIEILSGE